MTSPNLPDPVAPPLHEPGTAPTTASTTTTPVGTTATGKPARRVTPKDVVGIVFLILIVIFIAENGQRAKIRFVGPQVSTYLWLALLIATALGFVLGFALAWKRGRAVDKQH